jgi:hypothetical protein
MQPPDSLYSDEDLRLSCRLRFGLGTRRAANKLEDEADTQDKSGRINLEELTLLFSTTEEDFRRVHEFGELVSPKIDNYIELFYKYLGKSLGPDFDIHFPDEDTLARAQSASRRAWLEFFEADWSDEYIVSGPFIWEGGRDPATWFSPCRCQACRNGSH